MPNKKAMDRTILHCDNDAFYSTTEEMLNPKLRGKAHAVAGSVEDRNGIILAKSYVAKKFGVKTGEAIWQAKQKCPDLITMPPNYEMYLKYSKLANQIYSEYTDLIQPLGMDEAWLDLTGSTNLFGSGEEIARKLKARIKYELGLTISVGVSFCMVFAKLGSDLDKPDGLCVITEDNFREKLWHLPASDLFGVGFRTDAVLQRYGIRTIGQLATTPQELLQRKFGVRGIDLWAYANGLDRSKVQHQEYEFPIKSIGHGITTIQDLENTAEAWNVILALTQAVGYKLRNQKVKTVTSKLRREVVEKMEAVRKENIIPLKGLKKDMPFGQWVDFWYQYYTKNSIRETTRATYEGEIYKHIIPELGKIPLNKLTQADLQKFYADQLKGGRRIRQEIHGAGLANSTVRHMHMLCKSALDIAVQEGFIRDNPAVGCKLPPKTKGEMKVLTTEQAQRLLIQAKQDGYYELFLLEFATGLRIGELVALQWDDLNAKTGVLNIMKQVTLADGNMIMSKPKTKQSIRKIVLPRPVVNALLEYKNRVDSKWMFPSPLSNDRPWNPSGLRGRLDLELERAQCPKVRFHDLRHTYATMSLEYGMDVKTLSATLGHVSAATTLDIYSHVTSSMQKQAAVSIEKAIGKAEVEYTPEEPKPVPKTDFQPYKLRYRKSGTGMVRQISEKLWEGRYSPRDAHGKRIARNVYAQTEQECEEKLKVLIEEMKAEIKAEKALLKAQESGMTITM